MSLQGITAPRLMMGNDISAGGDTHSVNGSSLELTYTQQQKPPRAPTALSQ